MLKFEDDHFWPAEKSRFLFYLLTIIVTAAVLAFGVYGWILYQAKVKDSEMSSHPQTAPAAVSFNNGDTSTNAGQSSLSPETNAN